MNCKNATELLSDYVSGQLDRALTVSLENHLADCANCRKEAEGLRWTWSVLDDAPSVETPPFFHENLMSRIAADTAQAEAETARKRALWDWRNWFQVRSLAYAAASVILLLVLMGGLHAVHASFDPIGPLLKLFSRPAPVLELQTGYYDWVPDAQGHGALEIHLQARPKADGSLNILHYHVNLAGAPRGSASALDAAVTSEKESTLRVPLNAPPTGDPLTIKINAAEGEGEVKTLPLAPMMPSTAPH
ncbi:MAG TPA: zf-HC2 domain-containing protein [Chthonomonadaceae bacterium]|nr:zf-HC2 domain-containing protein [Chthonomonadaceae bacterium]